jgi:lipopolysaccharide/colanic/teichoic acid biosynthesis glycosyltransferase
VLSLTTLFRRASREKEFRDLYSHCQFSRALARERARADRSGDGFSLLTLGVKTWRQGEPTLVHLARVLRRRLRLTDEAGWLDRRHLGIIMPSTPAWGAWTLADDLCRQFPDDIPLPECKVYVYPTDWSAEERDWIEKPHKRTAAPRPAQSMNAFFVRRLPLWKRGMDVVVAAIALVLLAPLFLLVAAAVKLTSRGPVLFTQLRSGLGGRPFRIYKFRTMVVEAERLKADLLASSEQDGPAFKLKRDPRVTRIGQFLRTTSIDELPQLWNVLIGDMSLVGPRPLPCEETDRCQAWQRRRLDVTPGLTCIWQVKGRSRVSFADWVRMDMRYIRLRSLWYDLGLLLATVPSLVFRRGR